MTLPCLGQVRVGVDGPPVVVQLEVRVGTRGLGVALALEHKHALFNARSKRTIPTAGTVVGARRVIVEVVVVRRPAAGMANDEGVAGGGPVFDVLDEAIGDGDDRRAFRAEDVRALMRPAAGARIAPVVGELDLVTGVGKCLDTELVRRRGKRGQGDLQPRTVIRRMVPPLVTGRNSLSGIVGPAGPDAKQVDTAHSNADRQGG